MSNLTPQVQNEFKNQLAVFKTEVAKLLPAHITVDKFERVVYSVALRNPELLTKVDRRSFFDACVKAATFGVIPDGRKCTILPYGNRAEFTPMIGGIIEKLYNSGEVNSLCMNIVYENDKFKRHIDNTGEHIYHEPVSFGDRGKQIGVYCAVIMGKGNYCEVMNMNELMAIRNVAKSKNVWDGAFGTEMHKKAVFRRLSKRLPLSEENRNFIESDNESFDLSQDVPATKSQQVSALLESIKAEETIDPVTSVESEVPQVEDKGNFGSFNPQAIK